MVGVWKAGIAKAVALILLLVAAPAAAAPPADLDAEIRRILAQFGTPGLALTIVEQGQVTHARGHGLARLASATPADPQTLFPIGSNTKSMTATILAALVDEGRLDWDDRVQDRLPGFRMAEAYAGREMRVRDLLSHRSGLASGQGDLLFWPETRFTTEELMHKIGKLQPRHSFRAAFGYNNLMVAMAGQLASTVEGGASWEDLVQRRIFRPLGMSRTAASLGHVPAGAMLADLHILEPPDASQPAGTPPSIRRVERPADFRNASATGAVWSSAADMGRWLCSLVAGHDADGRPAGHCPAPASRRAFETMWTAHTPMPIAESGDGLLAEARPQFLAYGLGWQIRDWRGRRVVMHTGSVIGGVSIVVVMPAERVAFSILTNASDRRAYRALAFRLMDHYQGHPAVNWLTALADEPVSPTLPMRGGPPAIADPQPPRLALEAYAGLYRDQLMGDIRIAADAEGLRIVAPQLPRMEVRLRHHTHDTFLAHWLPNGLPDALVTFVIGGQGKVEEARIERLIPRAEDEYRDFRFVRRE